MLIGTAESVEEAVPARNIAERPAVEFLIEPRDHLAALKRARARGLGVVGFYHSHPRSEASPSPRDVSEASYPDHLFLIVSLAVEPPDVRLYRFVSEGLAAPKRAASRSREAGPASPKLAPLGASGGGNFLPMPFVKSPE